MPAVIGFVLDDVSLSSLSTGRRASYSDAIINGGSWLLVEPIAEAGVHGLPLHLGRVL